MPAEARVECGSISAGGEDFCEEKRGGFWERARERPTEHCPASKCVDHSIVSLDSDMVAHLPTFHSTDTLPVIHQLDHPGVSGPSGEEGEPLDSRTSSSRPAVHCWGHSLWGPGSP